MKRGEEGGGEGKSGGGGEGRGGQENTMKVIGRSNATRTPLGPARSSSARRGAPAETPWARTAASRSVSAGAPCSVGSGSASSGLLEFRSEHIKNSTKATKGMTGTVNDNDLRA